MVADQCQGLDQFLGRRRPTEGELVGPLHLGLWIGAHLAGDSTSEGLRAIESEPAVEEVECLDGRGGLTPARCRLAGIGAIECAEDDLPFHADLVRVDHALVALGAELLDALVAGVDDMG